MNIYVNKSWLDFPEAKNIKKKEKKERNNVTYNETKPSRHEN